MAGYRKIALKFLSGFNPLVGTKTLIKLTSPHYILPYYHCISDNPHHHINHLYKVRTSQEFSRDLDFFLKYFNPINPSDLINSKILSKSDKPPFIISFDDGLSEFHDVIAPLLEERGLGAICFLNSAFIDNKALFYRYKASLILNLVNNNNAVLKKVSDQDFDTFRKYVLSLRYSDSHLLDKIANKIDLDFDSYLEENKPYLSSTQIESLIKRGFYFGAHSIDHPLFAELNTEEQIRQYKESTAFVRNSFNLSYEFFSFPFTDHGVKAKFFKEIKRLNPDSITFGGAGIKNDEMANHFQRISIESNDLNAKTVLKTEMLYFILKAAFGKNKILRID